MFEFTKSIFNKVFVFLVAIFILSFLIGWFLPIGIDKVESLSYRDYLFSTFTVFTQFGFLMFSFIISFFINKEYSNKTILFYKLLSYDSLKFFINKVTVLVIESIILIAINLFIVSIIYQDFSLFLLMLFLFTAVVTQYIIIVGIISFLSTNILASIGISISYWILTVILVSSSEHLKYVAIFDASNFLYAHVDKVLMDGESFISFSDSLTVISYIGILLALSTVICKVMNKRWLKLGID
ncbi:peptide ABC transporter permease [Paenibacillus antibioticophila]|uniref:Peptide ABC transporter permease n=1 Tax=Paenibacillus antibioticophila TaxID=1274374 RepID=A0A919XTA6_9BACL|nr:peptide ABC transporter permease [Paenibacillus antibioticophila]GIO35958.1 peptide ABC transporter permease [Paenibacillus antibioticophila]